MALKLSSDAQSVFFEKVFGPSSPVLAKVKGLIAAGFTFETDLYTCKATHQGKVYQVSLTKGTTALMKGNVDVAFLTQNQKLVSDWVTGLSAAFGNPTAPTSPVVGPMPELLELEFTKFNGNFIYSIKYVRAITLWGLAQAKEFVESVNKGEPNKVGISLANAGQAVATALSSNVAAEGNVIIGEHKVAFGHYAAFAAAQAVAQGFAKVGEAASKSAEVLEGFEKGFKAAAKAAVKPGVIHLKDAEAIGQKVHGTSSGSVYHTVAIGERLRLAARLGSGGSVSIRAEWASPLTPAEKEKLAVAGLQVKGEYASMHLSAADVPFGKIVGAFVIGLGVEWQDIVKSSQELVVE